ncbi:thioredoxin domain-containing protein [Arthrobacter psychrolactophilus]|uniref:Thioredoxin domain-containing protein n=1 Tax=Arthrobacter psychrolactophilus TaxID=92442 RepID=A0A2V5IWZ5_9MICC|nr:thioredoxin domain-containing protein [Arthrobacter psychrolactophilus]PYI38793.1 thioredoxin domain-containing protein [Arthrobacter psychrolactophilus]
MNRLADEPSAYLRQHAHNPVAWQPFDDAAFAEAVARDVPIFLSVGYAACHWCHVMAGESFQDPAIGAYLNSHFVSIKVDREERPDVDDAYMAATQALSGEGGWPMSVFLTPDGRAFHAGTYFPPSPVSGRPSFTQVLHAVQEAWQERREQVERTASELAQALAQPIWQLRAVPESGVELEIAEAPEWAGAPAQAVAALAAAEDLQHGGFGNAPKFPPTPTLDFLLRHAASGAPTAELARGVAGRTLGAMVRSALFDQLGGGFARYSVSADWSEPHYEKMLYDNAGLLQALVQWIRLAGRAPDPEKYDVGTSTSAIAPLSLTEARDAVAAVVSWLLRELRLPGGAFASSLDADTVIDGVHHEGASYQWTEAELLAAARAGDVAESMAHEVAAAMGLGTQPAPLNPGQELSAEQQHAWRALKPALLTQRSRRVMPARDEKVVASWNAMLLGALTDAAMVLEEPSWLAAAVDLGEYLRHVQWDGVLFRVSHAGTARGIKGLLEDYAASAKGFLRLYAATGQSRHFEFAGQLLQALEEEFIADGVVFSHGAHDEGTGPLQGSRFADPFDNATASGVALLADALASWAAYTGSQRHRAIAENLLSGLPALVRRAPRAAGGLLAVAESLLAGPLELAVVGPEGSARSALLREAWLSPSPGLVVATGDGEGSAVVPLLTGRTALRDGDETSARAYVCRKMVCAYPVTTPDALRKLLS